MAYVDDLYQILITHWVYDDTVYGDERQRVQVATGLLMAAYFGCRPCSLFDTRVRFSYDCETLNATNKNKTKSNSNCYGTYNTSVEETLVNSHGDSDDDSDTDLSNDTTTGSDSDDESKGNGTQDLHPDRDDNTDGDSCTDDGYDAGTEETRSILYRHVTIIVVQNPNPNQPNVVLMKVTLLHTKGEDNKPKMRVFENPLCLAMLN